MKKLCYLLPLIGLLFFTSCEKEETDQIIDYNLETNPFTIEAVENNDGKIFTLAPGLYGPSETTPYTHVNYSLVIPQHILNSTPIDERKYYIAIRYQRPDRSGWTLALPTTYLPSNGTLLSFPSEFDGSKRYKWHLTYGYQGPTGSNYTQYKEIDINH